MHKNIFHCIVFVVSMMIFVNGCGNKSEDKSAVEKKTEESKSSEKDLKTEMSKTSDDANKTEEVVAEKKLNEGEAGSELGMSPGIPKDFPSDIPLPKNSKTLGSLNSSEGTVVTFESQDKVNDIIDFYKEEMKKNGYTVIEGGETLVSDKGGLINWVKEKKEVGLMLGFDKDKNITSFVITYK